RRGQLAYRYDPVGRLLEAQSRLGHETFDFDPASNLIDPETQREAERQRMPRIKALDNLLKQYVGTHYQYDARGNLTQRWHNGKEGRFTWDLFDRLTHYEDERLKVDYTYDALGRRLSKHSQAHYEERREAGPHWNRAERVKRNRALQCGFTLYGWDGDTLAWESKIADEDGFGARTTHYVYEPGSFVPVAQAVREDAIELLDQPEYGDYYRQDEDPLWLPPPPAPAINSLAWYQCDHLGTPQELTDEHSEIAWSAEYRAWGLAKEAIRKASSKTPIANPIRFQGQYHDHESGLHYNRYRYYDPEVGRFVSKDPIGYAGGHNLWQYAPNPIEWSDPLGLSKRCPCDCPAGTIDPSQVHFMQSSAKNVTGDYTVLANAQALQDGTLDPNILKTKIWKDGAGKLWTLDHRRLAAFKLARKCMPYQMASKDEIDNQMWKMSTKNGGTSIRLKMENGQSMTVE
ncbi:type IV secretion protein Rhs, partial [Burkholderia sp. Bp9012]